MNDRMGGLKRMYDDMEEYAGNSAADSSEALKALRGGGVPVMQESVTVVAKPKPGAKLSPEELKQKVGNMGLLGLLKGGGGLEDLVEPGGSDMEEALQPDDVTEEDKARLARMRAGR